MSRIKTYHHFIPKIKEEFPNLTNEQIERILQHGLFKLQFFLTIRRKDLLLKNNSKKFTMKVYKFIPLKFKALFKKNGSSQDDISKPES